jgi:hypothetical protein
MFPIGVSRLRLVVDDEIVSFDLTAALRRFGNRFDVQAGERRTAASEVFMKFRLGCELAYKVVAETVFIFNVQVAFLQRHINLVDQLNFNPNLPRRFYTVPDLRNRYTQVAPVGDLSLSYTQRSTSRFFEPILQRSTRLTFATWRWASCIHSVSCCRRSSPLRHGFQLGDGRHQRQQFALLSAEEDVSCLFSRREIS